jgi:cytochrome bd ubiquinol oxidase subunit II
MIAMTQPSSFWNRHAALIFALRTFATAMLAFSLRRGLHTATRRRPARAPAGYAASFAFLTPFPLLTGVALMFGYGLLGAGWLIMKTEGEIQTAARHLGRICLIGVVAAIATVSVWTPIMSPAVAERWFSWPNLALFAPVPMLYPGDHRSGPAPPD